MNTAYDIDIDNMMFANKLDCLINQFYKILPIKENGEKTLDKYLLSLQREMLGMQSLIVSLKDNAQYLTLLSILQYLIDHINEEKCTVGVVKSDVFKAIGILKKMKQSFAHGGGCA